MFECSLQSWSTLDHSLASERAGFVLPFHYKKCSQSTTHFLPYQYLINNSFKF